MDSYTSAFLRNLGYTDEEIKEIEDRVESLVDAEPIDYLTSFVPEGMQFADHPTAIITIEPTKNEN